MFELENASMTFDQREILALGTFSLGPGVHVVVGPAGTGKSLFLRALSARPMPEGIGMRGNWQYLGCYLWGLASREQFANQIVFVEQLRTANDAPARSLPRAGELMELLAHDPRRAWLLDEPERAFAIEDREAFVAQLRARGREGCVVIVSHHQPFVRAVADHVHLIAGGRRVVSCESARFFDDPPDELSARFVRTGNCWPNAVVPALPKHFHWLIPHQLAGMGRPGLLRDTLDDMTSVSLAGITHVVSLIENLDPAVRWESFGVHTTHLPITDMGVPSLDDAMRACAFIHRTIQDDGRVAVHCHAGLGRTGLILACYLIWRRQTASSALLRVRAVEPAYVQSDAQIRFLAAFEEALRTRADGDASR